MSESREFYVNAIEQAEKRIDNLSREAEELNARLARISEEITWAQFREIESQEKLDEMGREEREEEAQNAQECASEWPDKVYESGFAGACSIPIASLRHLLNLLYHITII